MIRRYYRGAKQKISQVYDGIKNGAVNAYTSIKTVYPRSKQFHYQYLAGKKRTEAFEKTLQSNISQSGQSGSSFVQKARRYYPLERLVNKRFISPPAKSLPINGDLWDDGTTHENKY